MTTMGIAALAASALLAPSDPGGTPAPPPMDVRPAWEGVFDGTTPAVLATADRELAGGRLFLAFRRQNTPGFDVRCADAATGALAWGTALGDGMASAFQDLAVGRDGREAFVLSSPGLRIERLRGADGSPEAFAARGDVAGRRMALTRDGRGVVAAGSAPGGGLAVAYARETGAELWTAPLPSGDVADLVVDARRAYLAVGTSAVALRLADGARLWSVDFGTLGAYGLEKAASDGPLVVTGPTGSRALDPASGAQLWFQGLAGTKRTALAPDGRSVYRLKLGLPSQLDALEVATGQVRWSAPVPNVLLPALADPQVSPDGALVAFTDGATTRAFAAADGSPAAALLFPAYSPRRVASVGFDGGASLLLVLEELATPTPPLVLRQAVAGGLPAWELVLEPAVGSAADHLRAGALDPDGLRYFAAGGSGPDQAFALAAFDAAGARLWSTVAAGVPAAERAAASSQHVFASAGVELSARDAATGALAWKRAGELPRDFVPAADGTALFVSARVDATPGDLDYAVRKLDAATGAELWGVVIDGEGLNDRPGPLALSPDGGALYVVAQERLTTPSGASAHVAVLALDTDTGGVLWETRSDEGGQWNGWRAFASPDGSRVHAVLRSGLSEAGAKRFVTYDAATGAELWRSPELQAAAAGLAPDGSTLAGAAPDTLIVLNQFIPLLRVYALDAATGAIAWDRTYPAAGAIEGADLIVTGAVPTVVVAAEGLSQASLALDLATGDPVWQVPAADGPGIDAYDLAALAGSDRVVLAHTSAGSGTADLRAAGYDLPALASPSAPLSLAQGGARELRLRAGPAHAGRAYWILGSASGSGAGIPLGGGWVLPLAADGYFAMTVQHAAPLFAGFAGVVPAHGEARAVLALPPGSDPSLAGVRLAHAGLVAEAGGAVSLVTNVVELALAP